MATHSSVLAWRIPRTGEPGGLSSTGSHSVRHDWSDLVAVVAQLVKNSELHTEEYKLFSQGCHNKVPKLRCLKPTEIYCLIVLEPRSSKSRFQQGHIISDRSRWESFLVSSSGRWFLPIHSTSWFVDARHRFHALFSSCLLFSPCLSYFFISNINFCWNWIF